jgi:hypothetical protein
MVGRKGSTSQNTSSKFLSEIARKFFEGLSEALEGPRKTFARVHPGPGWEWRGTRKYFVRRFAIFTPGPAGNSEEAFNLPAANQWESGACFLNFVSLFPHKSFSHHFQLNWHAVDQFHDRWSWNYQFKLQKGVKFAPGFQFIEGQRPSDPKCSLVFTKLCV